MNYQQYRLAKRNGEIIQQIRTMKSTVYTPKWYKPWDVRVEYEYGEWIDLPFVEIEDEDGSDHSNRVL